MGWTVERLTSRPVTRSLSSTMCLRNLDGQTAPVTVEARNMGVWYGVTAAFTKIQ